MSEAKPEAKNLHVVDGPLSRHKLAVLRDERTPTAEFRQAMKELALIMVAEATRDMPTRPAQIRTPLAETEVEEISGPVCLVPVLRAGLGVLDGALAPMLATGGSLSATLTKLKDEGAAWISCLHAVAAVPGVERLTREHPDVRFYAAAVDPELNDDAFIVPGLGDAGDRLYGTL